MIQNSRNNAWHVMNEVYHMHSLLGNFSSIFLIKINYSYILRRYNMWGVKKAIPLGDFTLYPTEIIISRL